VLKQAGVVHNTKPQQNIYKIVLLWFSIVCYSSLFQYFFYRSTIIPILVENSQFFDILVCIKAKNKLDGTYKWPTNIDQSKWLIVNHYIVLCTRHEDMHRQAYLLCPVIKFYSKRYSFMVCMLGMCIVCM